ncbi:hypothetical protein J8J14_12605 [Roseomonas sp. SSH11]|uniref:Uncharacterized protein n=1 Tax=Pararoseomonas baculiformis TaxID=2820812 RepID=A0ABS4AF32_9PROT|nr:hypothetical protein [Pararoseomonas baculiformis]MBP0445617.1 hypothetical protein [Pararoseomonas baculiformis]
MRGSDAARLARILARLGSDYDGERASAALAADRLMKRLGVSWEELLTMAEEAGRKPGPPPPDLLDAAQSRLRQCQRENADLQRQLTRLKQRLEVLKPRPAPPEEE